MSQLSTYVGIFLDQNSRGLLNKLKSFVPNDWVWYGDHMTIKFIGTPTYPEDFPEPYNELATSHKQVRLVVTHIGLSTEAIAVKVQGYPLDDKISHITLATPYGGSPKQSNNITNWKKIKSFTLHGTIMGNGDAGERVQLSEIDVTSDTVIPMGDRWNDQMDGGDYSMQVWAAPTMHVKYGGNMTEEIVKKLVTENLSQYNFINGDCDIYAVALHRLYGYPLYSVRGYYYDQILDEESYEDAHIIVKMPNGNYKDSTGEHTVDDLKARSLFMNKIERVQLEEISEEEALSAFSCSDQESDIQQIMKHLSSNNLVAENIENIKSLLHSTKVYDVFFDGKPSTTGWKLSIQGKNLNNLYELTDRLHTFLESKDIAHKIATMKRISHPDQHQSKKLMTIYVPDDMDVKDLAAEIEPLLAGYTGWHDIKTPPDYEHYSNAIFFRNDRDEQGDYKPASNMTETIVKQLTKTLLTEVMVDDIKTKLNRMHRGWITPNNQFIKSEDHWEYLRKIYGYPPDDTNYDRDAEFAKLYNKGFNDGLVRVDYQFIAGKPAVSLEGKDKSRLKDIIVDTYYPFMSKYPACRIFLDVPNIGSYHFRLPEDKEKWDRFAFGTEKQYNSPLGQFLTEDVVKKLVTENLVSHAKDELKRAGLFDKDADYGGMIGKAVMELMKVFSKQGHSGFSAAWVTDLFNKLAKFETLTPITSNPDEWNDVSEYMDGKPMWQSKRNPALFSKNGGKTWYNVDDKTIKEGIVMGVYGYAAENGNLITEITSTFPFNVNGAEATYDSWTDSDGDANKQRLDGGYMDLNSVELNEIEYTDITKLPFLTAIEKIGGKTYQVGGAVRDSFLGKQSKDLDIMVAGLTTEQLLQALKPYGVANLVGQSFGVIKFKPTGAKEDIDIALARADKKISTGHKGIQVFTDPSISVEQDMGRRDISINAIAKDIHGNIIDPFGGLKDLQNKIIRMVSPTAFAEDPLRMLRSVIFASRFNFTIEPKTLALIQQNAPDIKTISAERILEEFSKAITKGSPLIAARFLVDSKLYENIFDTQFKGSYGEFPKVKRMSEFIYLLTKDSLPSPAQFYKDKLRGDIDTYKEIRVFELPTPHDAASERWYLNKAQSISPDAIGSFVVQDKLKDVSMHPEDKYPLVASKLAVSGDEIKSVGIVNQFHGMLNRDLLDLIYNDKLENTRDAIMNYIQRNIDKYKPNTPQKIQELAGKIIQEKMSGRYYRATMEHLGNDITIEPQGYYEAVDGEGNPMMHYGEYLESETPEIAASETISGAVLGNYSMEHKAGTYYIYAIIETPDIDISHWDHGDFSYLREVRYRRPVKATLFKTINIGAQEVKIMEDYYNTLSANLDQDYEAMETVEFDEQAFSQLMQSLDGNILQESVIEEGMNNLHTYADKLVTRLNSEGIPCYIWHKATTGSAYIRFQDSRMASIRIADHDGKEQYRYKYNMIANVKKPFMRKEDNVWRLFYGLQHIDALVKNLKDAQSYFKKQGEVLAGGYNKPPVKEGEFPEFTTILKSVKERLPFLKKFKEYPTRNADKFQLFQGYGSTKMMWGDDFVTVKGISVSCELDISYRMFNNAKWLNVRFANNVYLQLPDDYGDQLMRTVLMKAQKMMNEKYSYSDEIRISQRENFSSEVIDNIINELNKKTFEFEEYLNTHFTRAELFEEPKSTEYIVENLAKKILAENYGNNAVWFIPDNSPTGGHTVRGEFHLDIASKEFGTDNSEEAYQRAFDAGWVRIVLPGDKGQWVFNGTNRINVRKAIQMYRKDVLYGNATAVYVDYQNGWKAYNPKKFEFREDFDLYEQTILQEESQQSFKYSDVVQVEKVILDYYGETDVTSCGYISPNGYCINLRGAAGNDHRNIMGVMETLPINWGIYDSPQWEHSHSKWLYIALDMGFIRVIPESGDLEIRTMPTQDQFTRLREFVTAKNGQVVIDLYGTDQNYVQFERHTETDYIIECIKRFFNYGEIPNPYDNEEDLMEVRHENYKNYDINQINPINDDETLIVYHGFGGHSKKNAKLVVKFGLSGKQNADRTYSYETVNNPKGLFVSIDFNKVKKEFANSGIIIEFATKVSNLEAPVWAGGGSYFVQGDYTSGFANDDEREAQRMQNREREQSNPYPAISKSSRPELAQTLFQNAERQALFIGDLNPNMIRAVWVNETLMLSDKWGGEWVRISRGEFLRKYFDSSLESSDKYYDATNKIFRPNDDFNLEQFKVYLAKHKYNYDDFVEYYIKDWDNYVMNTHFYPKQIAQIKQMFNVQEQVTIVTKQQLQEMVMEARKDYNIIKIE